MSYVTVLITRFLAILTVVGNILAVFLVAVLLISFFKKDIKFPLAREVVNFFGRNAVLFSFLTSLGAVLGSLYYSVIVGFPPCQLCWIQRIFIYPQAIILGLALIKKDDHLADYIIVLSAVGGTVSTYHQYIQFGGRSLYSCASGLGAVSCTQRLILEFGYVTIPMMMLTIFLLNILFAIAQKKWILGGRV